ncbi:ATP-binding cassette domain-containing protein [Sulfitobacter sp.]|uniref:ATP-binding cassette domain-containing protein n=1 Tax=Sulfitobacter sp. TaxID=1903071 RepID=UPI0030032122
MADQIKILLPGEEVEQASARERLANPQQEYTKSLWAVRDFRREPRAAEANTDETLLDIKNISAAYGTVQVLNDVSLSIKRGRTVAVVGESGSGKSTLARVVMGLLPPTDGEIIHDGTLLPKSGAKRSRGLQRHLQMIHQMADTALNPKQWIKDIVSRPLEFFLGMKGAAKGARIKELLTLIKLDPGEFMNRLPSELSGGQKQRICIARALAAEPDFIICDEVTSALDQLVAEGTV